MPIGFSSNASKISPNGRPNDLSSKRFVCASECGFPFECSRPNSMHNVSGNRSLLDPAHCASYAQASDLDALGLRALYLDERWSSSFHLQDQ